MLASLRSHSTAHSPDSSADAVNQAWLGGAFLRVLFSLHLLSFVVYVYQRLKFTHAQVFKIAGVSAPLACYPVDIAQKPIFLLLQLQPLSFPI